MEVQLPERKECGSAEGEAGLGLHDAISGDISFKDPGRVYIRIYKDFLDVSKTTGKSIDGYLLLVIALNAHEGEGSLIKTRTSLRKLAGVLGKSKETIRKSKNRLVEHGYLKVLNVEGTRNCVYVVDTVATGVAKYGSDNYRHACQPKSVPENGTHTTYSGVPENGTCQYAGTVRQPVVAHQAEELAQCVNPLLHTLKEVKSKQKTTITAAAVGDPESKERKPVFEGVYKPRMFSIKEDGLCSLIERAGSLDVLNESLVEFDSKLEEEPGTIRSKLAYLEKIIEAKRKESETISIKRPLRQVKPEERELTPGERMMTQFRYDFIRLMKRFPSPIEEERASAYIVNEGGPPDPQSVINDKGEVPSDDKIQEIGQMGLPLVFESSP